MKVLKLLVFTLYIVVVAVLVCSTLVQQLTDNDYALRHIYNSNWFAALWILLAAAAAVYMYRRRKVQRWPVMMLHSSLALIIAGGLCTQLTASKGHLHLRVGQRASAYIDTQGRTRPLPFSIRLDRFSVSLYSGTDTPSDFTSRITVFKPSAAPMQATVSMNNIYSSQGFRLYQNSFDPDCQGSVFSVNHDPWGIGLTYTGYLLFALSAICVLAGRGQRFRSLLSQMRGRALLLPAALFLAANAATARSLPSVNKERAQQIARQQVVYCGRVAPFGTVAADFMKKVHGSTSYHGLTPEQVACGWMARPDVWKNEPMIKVDNANLRRQLGAAGRFVSLASLFNSSGRYRLLDMEADMNRNTATGKALRQLDERVGIILMLTQGSLYSPLPPKASRLSPQRVEAELLYTRVPFAKILFMADIAAGLLLFMAMLCGFWRRRLTRALAWAALWASLATGVAGYALRWYAGGRVPLSNGFETMLLLSLLILVVTAIVGRKMSRMLPFGLVLSGFTLLVAHLGQMNPQITPLMPVLQSPLLSLHVSVVMVAYALFAFTMLAGVYALALMPRRANSAVAARIEQLTLMSRLMHYPATFLLAAGIFLGATWANISWGSYWSWDPKETWALITLLVYAVPFHTGSIAALRRPLPYHIYMVAAFLSILMTYFGVSFLFTGMHSYA